MKLPPAVWETFEKQLGVLAEEGMIYTNLKEQEQALDSLMRKDGVYSARNVLHETFGTNGAIEKRKLFLQWVREVYNTDC